MEHSTLYYFFYELVHQLLFWIGGIIALVDLAMTKWKTPIPRAVFTWLFLGCLFVAFIQAWVDEHRVVVQLISDKVAISEEREFWKGQSYAKDESIRKQTELLAQNFQTLTMTQRTGNETQKSLTTLSEKILDINKPIETKANFAMSKFPPETRFKHALVVVFTTNKPITPATLIFGCQRPISRFDVHPANGSAMGGGTFAVDGRVWQATISFPAWTPEVPLVGIAWYDDEDLGTCQFGTR